ncbi:hypothetical protein V8E36_007244 [Tilletia maclaganii]
MKFPMLPSLLCSLAFLAGVSQAASSVSTVASSVEVECYIVSQRNADGATQSLAPLVEAAGVEIRPKTTVTVTATAPVSTSTTVKVQVYTTKTVTGSNVHRSSRTTTPESTSLLPSRRLPMSLTRLSPRRGPNTPRSPSSR